MPHALQIFRDGKTNVYVLNSGTEAAGQEFDPPDCEILSHKVDRLASGLGALFRVGPSTAAAGSDSQVEIWNRRRW